MTLRFLARTTVSSLLFTMLLVTHSHALNKPSTHVFLSQSLDPIAVYSGIHNSVSCTDLYRISDYVSDPIASVIDKFPFRPCYQRHSHPGRDLLTNAYVSNGERVILLRHWISPVDRAGTVTSMGAYQHKQRNNKIMTSWLNDDLPLQVVLYSGKPTKLNDNIKKIIE